jgi:hypothetical protein
MKNQHQSVPSKIHGFRCSILDVIVLALAATMSFWLFRAGIEAWWIVPVVTLHFFLFCNVFLVWRRWELLWAGYFVAIVGWRFSLGDWTFLPALWYVLPATLVVILLQMRSPFYHGIMARRINPRLEEFLNNQLS